VSDDTIDAAGAEEPRASAAGQDNVDGAPRDGSAPQAGTVTPAAAADDIFKGVVTRVELSLRSAFVDIGQGREAVLPFDDVHPEYYEDYGRSAGCLPAGRQVLVQIVREPSGTKGAALTTYLTLAGRRLVLTPGRQGARVSKKITGEDERARLRAAAGSGPLPGGVGVIVRTEAEGARAEELAGDLAALLELWEEVRDRGAKAPAPSLVRKEPAPGAAG
jgi:ribonuclease E